jgi:addiction module RelE/StbE family toxin
METYNLIFSELAYNDLEEIVIFISRDSKVNAINFYNKLIETIDKLKTFPMLGILIPDKKMSEKGYRMLIVNNYIAFYKIHNKDVQVLRVLHGSRGYPRLFRSI